MTTILSLDRRTLLAVSYFASTDPTRPVLQGVQIKVHATEHAVRIAATDTHMLGVIYLTEQENANRLSSIAAPQDVAFVLPIGLLKSYLTNPSYGVMVQLSYDNGEVTLISTLKKDGVHVKVTVPAMDVTFPRIERVIPRSQQVTTLRQSLNSKYINTLHRAMGILQPKDKDHACLFWYSGATNEDMLKAYTGPIMVTNPYLPYFCALMMPMTMHDSYEWTTTMDWIHAMADSAVVK